MRPRARSCIRLRSCIWVWRPLRAQSFRPPDAAALTAAGAPVVVQSIFELVKKLCTQGYTVLIVEQNIRQVLKVVDRAYLLETGRIKSSGTSAELLASDEIRKAYLGI